MLLNKNFVYLCALALDRFCKAKHVFMKLATFFISKAGAIYTNPLFF